MPSTIKSLDSLLFANPIHHPCVPTNKKDIHIIPPSMRVPTNKMDIHIIRCKFTQPFMSPTSNDQYISGVSSIKFGIRGCKIFSACNRDYISWWLERYKTSSLLLGIDDKLHWLHPCSSGICLNGHMNVLISNHVTLNENGRCGSNDNDVDLSSLPIFRRCKMDLWMKIMWNNWVKIHLHLKLALSICHDTPPTFVSFDLA